MRYRIPEIAALLFVLFSSPVLASEITVYKSPTCTCCEGWIGYVRAHGFTAKIVETDDLDAVNAKWHVPDDLRSCHTATVDGYVIEGHVPAEAINKMLAEKPHVIGIAVPGMPQGSPGMPGDPVPFTVFSFGPDGEKPYMQF